MQATETTALRLPLNKRSNDQNIGVYICCINLSTSTFHGHPLQKKTNKYKMTECCVVEKGMPMKVAEFSYFRLE